MSQDAIMDKMGQDRFGPLSEQSGLLVGCPHILTEQYLNWLKNSKQVTLERNFSERQIIQESSDSWIVSDSDNNILQPDCVLLCKTRDYKPNNVVFELISI